MKSWKTTLGGILAGIGGLLQLSPEPRLHAFGVVACSIGTFIIGGAARDNNVTSEQAGTKP